MVVRGSKGAASALLIVYFVVMFPLLDRLEQVIEYGSYYFEAAFVALVWILFRPRLSFKIPVSPLIVGDSVGMAVAGFVVFRLAGALSLPNPFDLHSRELLCFLLVIGPLTEELVFRGALWELIAKFVPRPIALIIVTSAIFSFAHFYAWWSVPRELHGFVLYQTAYTLCLGAYCGTRRAGAKSIAVPLLAHACFNLGFYLGFLT